MRLYKLSGFTSILAEGNLRSLTGRRRASIAFVVCVFPAYAGALFSLPCWVNVPGKAFAALRVAFFGPFGALEGAFFVVDVYFLTFVIACNSQKPYNAVRFTAPLLPQRRHFVAGRGNIARQCQN